MCEIVTDVLLVSLLKFERADLTHCSDVSIDDFEQVNRGWLVSQDGWFWQALFLVIRTPI